MHRKGTFHVCACRNPLRLRYYSHSFFNRRANDDNFQFSLGVLGELFSQNCLSWMLHLGLCPNSYNGCNATSLIRIEVSIGRHLLSVIQLKISSAYGICSKFTRMHPSKSSAGSTVCWHLCCGFRISWASRSLVSVTSAAWCPWGSWELYWQIFTGILVCHI